MTIRWVLRTAALVAVLLVLAVSAAIAVTVNHGGRKQDAAPVALPTAESTSVYQPSSPAASTSARKPTRPATSRPATTKPAPSRSAPAALPKSVAPKPAAPRSTLATSTLPVAGSTAGANQIITVDAPAWGATQATLQAWQRHGAGWTKVGPAVPAWLGDAGMTTNAREGFTGTPVGSFGLTQAFGNNADPGSPMPYFRAGPEDWWVGDSSSAAYNTHQRCTASTCSFSTSESENLHDVGWVYGYAVVINYNTAPVRPGKGSAFFLHVTENRPTEGCVSIPAEQLIRILRWLDPANHPRIIMGVG